jgi:hypothetical protein
LAPFAAGFQCWLRSRAYSPSAAADRLYQFDQLSRWLERGGLGVGELTGEQAERFAAARRAAGLASWAAPQSVALPLAYLRELGAAPAASLVIAEGPLEALLADYRRYLLVERRLSEHTALDAYGPAARLFLAGWETPDGLGLERLSAADVSLFLARECPKRSVSGARDLVCALRSLLRYLHLAGWIEAPLVWAVPSVADLRDRTLPRGLESAAVRKLLVSCDRRTLVGRDGATSRSCCCWRGSGCVPARSPRSSLTTSTGGLGCCSSAGRAAGRICCRCPSTSVRRSCPIFAGARGASAERCSCE